MKLLKLTLVMILSLAMLTGCGGGGGGSSNPTGPAPDLTLQEAYPGIYASYSLMQTTMEDNDLNLDDRINSFMSVIAEKIYLISDTAKETDKRTVLYNKTKDRLDRYTVNSWNLVPFAHTKIDDKTVQVNTRMVLSFTVIPGKVGDKSGTYYFGDTSNGEAPIVFTWVKEADDKWRLQQGFPDDVF
ncbi:MAG: hypothetical protein GX569_09630 [Candidatus Riflebacteria bacterium]|nr:hypothetical protein [Candidatus Riflebacteria bacterium]